MPIQIFLCFFSLAQRYHQQLFFLQLLANILGAKRRKCRSRICSKKGKHVSVLELDMLRIMSWKYQKCLWWLFGFSVKSCYLWLDLVIAYLDSLVSSKPNIHWFGNLERSWIITNASTGEVTNATQKDWNRDSNHAQTCESDVLATRAPPHLHCVKTAHDGCFYRVELCSQKAGMVTW